MSASGLALGALIALLVLVAWSAHERRAERFALEATRPVRGPDGAWYRVHTGYGDPERAAATLAELNKRALRLMRHLRGRYAQHGSPERRHAVALMLRRYNPDSLAENSPLSGNADTSYTLDKGALVALCLRERDPKRSGDPARYDVEDIDLLTFVMLHEMGHVATDTAPGEDAHSPNFWATFKFLLEEADMLGFGMHRAVNARKPRKYCGMSVAYNPLHDAGRQALP